MMKETVNTTAGGSSSFGEDDFGRNVATSAAGAIVLATYLVFRDWVLAALAIVITFPIASSSQPNRTTAGLDMLRRDLPGGCQASVGPTQRRRAAGCGRLRSRRRVLTSGQFNKGPWPQAPSSRWLHEGYWGHRSLWMDSARLLYWSRTTSTRDSYTGNGHFENGRDARAHARGPLTLAIVRSSIAPRRRRTPRRTPPGRA